MLNSGAVYVFKDTSAAGDWSSYSEAKLKAGDASGGAQFGERGLSISDGIVAVGALGDDNAYGTNAGAVYLFQDTSGVGDWTTHNETKIIASDVLPFNHFGHSVDVEGDTVIAGSNSDHVYVFKDTSAAGNWSTYSENKFTSTDRTR